MPFFVREKAESVKIGVHIVKAANQGAARLVPLTEDTRQGYYTDDSDALVTGIVVSSPSNTGPFKTLEEARKSEAGWIEDV